MPILIVLNSIACPEKRPWGPGWKKSHKGRFEVDPWGKGAQLPTLLCNSRGLGFIEFLQVHPLIWNAANRILKSVNWHKGNRAQYTPISSKLVSYFQRSLFPEHIQIKKYSANRGLNRYFIQRNWRCLVNQQSLKENQIQLLVKTGFSKWVSVKVLEHMP